MPNIHGHLDLQKFRDLIKRHGTMCRYSIAQKCDCGSKYDNQTPDYQCSDCHGIGIRYTKTYKLMLLVLNKSTKALTDRWGSLEQGTIGISMPDTFRDVDTKELVTSFVPSAGDMIECFRDRMRKSDVLIKGKYHHQSGRSLECADYLHVFDGTSSITQINNRKYVESVDYRITEDERGFHRKIEWIGQNRPIKGQRYTFQYETYPTYIILPSMPKHRREYSKPIMPMAIAYILDLADQYAPSVPVQEIIPQ